MEVYTDLEQAAKDPSLAIITEEITTPLALNKAFFRYRTLPKKQKRYSNYYSTRFLGHDVEEMYVLLKDKMAAERDPFKDVQTPVEKYAHTEPDLYYKEESFNAGDTNLCFILGHSGSGKSIMARTLEGDHIDHIELDDLLLVKDHFTFEDLDAYSDMFAGFFRGEGAGYYIGVEERDRLPKEEYEDKLFIDFVRYALDFAKQHPEKSYVIDGIWIYLYFDDPSVFEDYAVFIKGTSFLKSKIRVMKREHQRDKEEIADRKQMFGREVRNYLLDEDKIDRYRNYFGEKPETIYREEASEADKKAEAVLSELYNINKCFVNEDANGIIEIKKKAEANPELSRWDKLRIISDCQAALIEL